MKKIIHVIPRLGNGGAEKLLLATVPHFIEGDMTVKVICLTDESEISKQLKEKNVEVICIDGMGRMFDIFSILKLLKIFYKEKPDLIMSHLLMANFFSFIGSIISFKKHVPMIHNLNVENSFFDNFLNLMIKLFAYKVLCVSNAVKNYEDIACPKFIKSKTKVLYNAVDASFFINTKQNPVEKNKDFIFICSGRLVAQKRHKDLINAFSQISYLDKSKLIILGDGPLMNDLIDLAKSLDINDKCIFEGHVDNVDSYLDKADLFIYPSEREGNPLALIEALAKNLPVILSDIDCHLELFSEEKNIFFETHNINSLKDKINSYCKDNIKYASSSRMSENELSIFKPENYVNNLLEAVK